MLKEALREFKAFALRGNVIDLAVGVIIGVAFNAVVDSLVGDVIMSGIAAFFGKPDFSALKFNVGKGVFGIGALLTSVINFLIVAFALFVLVKAVNRLARPKDASPEPTRRECPFCMTSIPMQASRCSACTSEVEPEVA
ncbi:MAG: large conductance mechanosensitive channel protein MscL [Candidatus Methylomirabilales bacterium]